MERKFSFSLDEYYHIYNRGTERREIFLDKYDKERFLKLLYILNSEKSFKFRDVKDIPYQNISRGNQRTAIGAFCLMAESLSFIASRNRRRRNKCFYGKTSHRLFNVF